MGMSWFVYAGTLEQVEYGYLLIPDYARDWAGTDKLEIVRGGDYADFQMLETPHKDGRISLNGHVLIGVFEKLYHNEPVSVTLTDCYYDDFYSPDDDERLREYNNSTRFVDKCVNSC